MSQFKIHVHCVYAKVYFDEDKTIKKVTEYSSNWDPFSFNRNFQINVHRTRTSTPFPDKISKEKWCQRIPVFW